MKPASWRDLRDYHCGSRLLTKDNKLVKNPHYEDMANRRFNYSPDCDKEKFRLVFLKDVLSDPSNKTLVRDGRFIWCKGLKYEGRDSQGFRQVSFTVDKGKKRFLVAENNILCLPVKIYVSNNRYFRSKLHTFSPFSSIFSYKKTLRDMKKNSGLDTGEFTAMVETDNPFRPGSLVAPRLGYFYPDVNASTFHGRWDEQHPYGIILGPSFDSNDATVGREFYRVRFGDTTYERVHPVQLEMINEV